MMSRIYQLGGICRVPEKGPIWGQQSVPFPPVKVKLGVWWSVWVQLRVKSCSIDSKLIWSICAVLTTKTTLLNTIHGTTKKCSDPCLRHKKPKKTRLGVISLETAKSINRNTEYRVIPGQSLCYQCRQPQGILSIMISLLYFHRLRILDSFQRAGT